MCRGSTMWLFVLLAACSDYDFVDQDTDVDAPLDTAADTADPEEPVADALVYAHTGGELYEIEPSSGQRTLIGSFRDGGLLVDNMVDTAVDMSGRMFGGTHDALYQIDPTTAAVQKICNTQLAPYALAFTSDGVLIAGAGHDIVEVHLSNCSTTPLVSNSGYETSGDLVGLPDGYLYWTVRGSNSDGLVQIDPSNGFTNWVGNVGAESLYGLGYDEGQLYGFSSKGQIVRIEPGSGSTTVLVSDGTSWWGATTNPVLWD